MLDAKIPAGNLDQKWTWYKGHCNLVNPANKRKLEIIVIGTGLAGASAAAALGELGYKVKAFCFQDSPRRAHSIAAQGGINAAKNYQNDGDSVFRLFYDTIKGGDYRAREGNVHRLAEVSGNIIDQCVAQGVPFAREYGGLLSNRSFGGTQVQRTFYAAGQTGQQLLIGAYQSLERQISLGNVKMYNRHEMLEIVTIEGKTRGIIARDLVSGKLERHFGHAVLLCSGGYGNVFIFPPTPWAAMLPPPGKRTGKELTSPIPASHRFTPHASPLVETTNRSSPSCLRVCVMMVASGFPRKKTITAKRWIFLKKKGITTSKEDILLSVTSFPVTWPAALLKSVVMPVTV